MTGWRMKSAAFVALALLSGCTPGWPSGGSSGFTITAEFTDVLDLVPQAAVKVNDVTVGSVEQISLRGWTAVVRMKVDPSVRLPDNATAAVRQSSLLGEKFVALAAPAGEQATGALSGGDLIPIARTRRTAEVEEVLAALGMLLNGGGLAQLKTINMEVAQALAGRESEAKEAVRGLDTFIAGLDAQKAEIVRAIEAMDRLTVQLAAQRKTIGAAVDALDPGLTTLAEQRGQLTAALTALGKLSGVGKRVIERSRADTLANLRALQPLLDQLVRAGDDLPKALDFMLSYPFPPNITGAIVGNQVNLHVTLDLNVTTVLENLVTAPGTKLPVPTIPRLPLPTPPPLPLPAPTVPGLPLPTLPGLPLGAASPSPGAGELALAAEQGVWPPAGFTPIEGEAAGVRGNLHMILIGGLR